MTDLKMSRANLSRAQRYPSPAQPAQPAQPPSVQVTCGVAYRSGGVRDFYPDDWVGM